MSAGNVLKRITGLVGYIASAETLENEPEPARSSGSFLGDIAARETLPQEATEEPAPLDSGFLAWLLRAEALAEEPELERPPRPRFLAWLLGPERLERDDGAGAER